MIAAGLSGANALDLKLSQLLGVRLIRVEGKTFPDGETYIRFHGGLEGETLVIVQTLYPNQDRKLFELLLSVDTAKDLGCKEVVAVVPYLAYSRQDRRFLDGEAVSVKAVLKLLGCVGVDYLITVDIHKAKSLEYFHGKALNLDPIPLIADSIRNVVKEPVIIAPDQGASDKARELAQLIPKADYVVFKKYRDRSTGEVFHEALEIDIAGRDAVIVDDIISTGTTIANIASYIKERGVSRTYVVCSHPLFVGDALNKLRSNNVFKVYALNTVAVPEGVESIDVAPLIAGALRNLTRI